MEIITIVGARPQFIKLAPVTFEISKRKKISENILHTGQHFDSSMSDIFFEEMSIPKPKYNLNIGGGTHASNTGRMLEGIEKILIKEKPNLTLVYGDTDSTLAGALASAKLNIPVVHVEAGLRSFNKKMPEEINRVLTDHLSSICFAPTDNAINNLIKEGIDFSKIFKTDDVMADAARIFGELSDKKSKIIKNLNLIRNNFVLATIHRAENTANMEILESILFSLSNCSISKMKVVFPLHPRTKKAIFSYALDHYLKDIICIEPVGYLDMIQLEKFSSFIITDSGGVQKEAFFHKKHCLTLRTETEWTELVNQGYNTLVNPIDRNNILRGIFNILDKKNEIIKGDIYGEGYAAKTIVDKLEDASNLL